MTTKEKIALFVLIFGIIVLTVAFYSLKIAVGKDGLSGKTIIDHDAGTIVHNESVEFGVKTTVHVEESDCLKCLKQFTCDECKNFTCEDVSCND